MVYRNESDRRVDLRRKLKKTLALSILRIGAGCGIPVWKQWSVSSEQQSIGKCQERAMLANVVSV